MTILWRYIQPLKTIPITSELNIQRYKEHPEDPAVATVRRKQARLSTINEELVHLSFHRLKILDRSENIPKELSTVDAQICTGCA